GMRPTTDDAALLERDDRAAHGVLRAPGVPNDLLRGGGPRREMDDHRHVVAAEPVAILDRHVDRRQVAVGDLEEPQSDPFAAVGGHAILCSPRLRLDTSPIWDHTLRITVVPNGTAYLVQEAR